MKNELPFVSIVIPVLNGERTICACLTSLLQMDYPEERREIIVVDNGSTDRTYDIVKTFPVRYILEKRRSIPLARNRGIEASRNSIIAFTDSDCVVSRKWLRELVQGFNHTDKIGGIEGETVDFPPTTPVEHYAARRRSFSYNSRRLSPLSPYAITANVAFRREVFHCVGMFDTRFTGGSDVDFSWRFFEKTDLELNYNPRAIVFHQHRQTVRAFFSQHVRNGRGIAMLRLKYPDRLPWSWRKELKSWYALSGFAFKAGQAAVTYRFSDCDKMGLYDRYFTLLRKTAVRLGYLWETLGARQV